MITNTNKRGRVSDGATASGSDEVLAEESLFMFAEQRGRKVIGVKTDFEKWCESFPIPKVLKRFGVQANPGDRVVIKNYHLGEQMIRIDEDGHHFYYIYGVGADNEFESDFPQDAYDLVKYHELGYRRRCGSTRETLIEVENVDG